MITSLIRIVPALTLTTGGIVLATSLPADALLRESQVIEASSVTVGSTDANAPLLPFTLTTITPLEERSSIKANLSKSGSIAPRPPTYAADLRAANKPPTWAADLRAANKPPTWAADLRAANRPPTWAADLRATGR